MLHFLSLSDATDLCSIKQAAQQVGSLLGTGGLNLLINNAGFLAKATLQDTTPEDMQGSFNTNVMGPMNIIKVRREGGTTLFFFFFKTKEGNWVVPSRRMLKVFSLLPGGHH